jgi:hypothetical protein
VLWNSGGGVTMPQMASARVQSNVIQVRVWGVSQTTPGGTMNLLNAISVTLYVMAW